MRWVDLMNYAFKLATLMSLALLGVGCAGIPNCRLDAVPGPLQIAYQAESRHPEPDKSGCHDRHVDSKVTEIALERTACYGACPMYTVTLHADGTAAYIGRGNVRLLGEHHGQIDTVLFSRLAALAEELGITEQPDTAYSCEVSDNPTAYVSVVKAGDRHVVQHYAPDLSGPVTLWWFEQVIDDVASEIEWD
jgi:hypothetical protein